MTGSEGWTQDNPYAAPSIKGGRTALTDVYKPSLRGLSVQDLRAIASSRISFVFLCVARLLRLEFATIAGTPLFDRLEEVTYEAIPEPSRNSLIEIEAACQGAGMRRQFCYRSPIIAPGPADFGLIYCSQDSRITVNLMSQWQRHTRPIKAIGSIVASSRHGRDGWLISSNHPWWGLEPPPNTERRHDPNWSPEELLLQHGRWISEREHEVRPIDPDRLLEVQARKEREFLQMMIDRGILVPMTECELQGLLRQIEADGLVHSQGPDSTVLTRLKFGQSAAVIAMVVFLLLSMVLTDGPAAILRTGVILFLLVWLGLTVARRRMG
ncbi:hypothetical protein [Tautonia rosea]|uniref:hypothetical protein n=1 Tax=Tautonia rosea TaxID=2728037 RepID=UPI001475C5C1|nr:hypothetical protein [Tautonia rosea]